MNKIDEQHHKRRQSRSERKKILDDVAQQSSKLGYVIVLVCICIVIAGVFATQQFTKRVAAVPTTKPINAITASALSTFWTCPLSAGQNSDTILLANPDRNRDAELEITSYDAAGALVGKTTRNIPQASSVEMPLSAVKGTTATSITVESIASSIVVFRNMTLTDGTELVPCISRFYSRAVFPNLQTTRNSNSVLVLANPFDESIVVDIIGNLHDTSIDPPRVVLDEIRGVIIPAHGHVNVDLQAEFGRYNVVSAQISSRSGAFVAEALVTFSGADSIQGQTVMAATDETTDTNAAYWAGVSPTRIVAYNMSNHTYSLQLDALGFDKRSLSGELQSVAPGAGAVLDNVGTELSTRLQTVTLQKGRRPAANIYISWLHGTKSAVSSGPSSTRLTERSFIPVTSADELSLYNPQRVSTTVTLSLYGTSEKQKVTLASGAYVAVNLDRFDIDKNAVIDVVSSHPIALGAADGTFTRYASGIEIQP